MIKLTREEAQQVLDALEDIRYADISDSQRKAIETLRARLSAPEPEPVAWAYRDSSSGNLFGFTAEHYDDEPAKNLVPLYLTPPQREWQGLTDDDRQELAAKQYGWEGLCSAVEAKLKEKNS